MNADVVCIMVLLGISLTFTNQHEMASIVPYWPLLLTSFSRRSSTQGPPTTQELPGGIKGPKRSTMA